jgi:hypothetical protein
LKSDESRLDRVEAQLNTVIRLLALSVIPDGHSLKDRAVRLHRAGLAPKDIAALCGTTANTVSVVLSAAKREGKARRKSRG